MVKKVLCYHADEVSQMIADGVSYSSIARHFDVDPSTVREYCKRHDLILSREQICANMSKAQQGLKKSGAGRKKWTVDRDILEALVDERLSQKDIAERLGVSEGTIRRVLKEYDLSTHPVITRKKKHIDFTPLWDQGMTVAQIAEETGLNINTIYRHLKLSGIEFSGSMPTLSLYHDEIQSLIYDGQTIRYIAEAYDVSYDTARDYVRRFIDYPEELKQANINKFFELNRNTEDDVRRKVSEGNPLLEYVSGYTRKQDPIHVRCLVCDNEFEVNFHTVVHKTGGNCPYCLEAERAEKEAQRKAEAERKAEEREQQRQQREEERARLHDIWLENRRHNCPVCGKETIRPIYCSEGCSRKASDKRKELTRRIRIKEQMVDKDITLEGLFKRDRGVCHICNGQCDYEDYVVVDKVFIAGDWYPSIDHVVALSNGGEHSWSNVRLAHRICNTKKSNS